MTIWKDPQHKEWTDASRRTNKFVDRLVENRGDITVVISPDTRSEEEKKQRTRPPGVFYPTLGRLHLDASQTLPKSLKELSTLNLNSKLSQRRYPAFTGVTVHESAHARHTLNTDATHDNYFINKWIAALEEPRCEHKMILDYPQYIPHLKSASKHLFGEDAFVTPNLKATEELTKRYEAARITILLIGRAVAGILSEDEVAGIKNICIATIGSKGYRELRKILDELMLLEDTDCEGLVALAIRVHAIVDPSFEAENTEEEEDDTTPCGSPLPQDEEDEDEKEDDQNDDSDEDPDKKDDSKDEESDEDSDEQGAGEESDEESDEQGEGSGAGEESDEESDEQGEGSGEGEESDEESDEQGEGSGKGEESDEESDSEGQGKSEGKSSQSDDSDGKSDSDDSGQGDAEGESKPSNEDQTKNQEPSEDELKGDSEPDAAPSQKKSKDATQGDSDEDSDEDGDSDVDESSADREAGNRTISDLIKEAIEIIGEASEHGTVEAADEGTPSVVAPEHDQIKEDAQHRKQIHKAKDKIDPPSTGRGAGWGWSETPTIVRQTTSEKDLSRSRSISLAIEKAQFRDVHRTEVDSMLPPGRFNVRQAMNRRAQISMKQEVTATPWTQTLRREVDNPPITLAIASDISYSMSAWQREVSSFTWAFSNAVSRLEGQAGAVVWNSDTYSLINAGYTPQDIPVAKAAGGSSGLPGAMLALDGLMDLSFGEGVRVLAVITDGELPNNAEIQPIIDTLASYGVIILWILTDSSGWKPKNTTVAVLKTPEEFGTVVGDKVIEALSNA